MTVYLGGDIGTGLHHGLQVAAETAGQAGGLITIDLAKVTYLGEVGLHFICTLLRRRPGAVAVINLHGDTHRLLTRTGMVALLNSSDTPADTAS